MSQKKPNAETVSSKRDAPEKRVSATIVDDMVDTKNLHEYSRRLVDPADIRRRMTLRFAPHEHLPFMRNMLIMGIDDQMDVKCLIPLDDGSEYTQRTYGGGTVVHGSDLSIYTGIHLLPIDQRLEEGTTFELIVPYVEHELMARAIFSESIKSLSGASRSEGAKRPEDGVASTATAPEKKQATGTILPFNRRFLIFMALPNESLKMQFRVGKADNYSIRERTYWWLDGPDGLVVGTQLDRDPIEYIKLIVRQIMARMAAIENNRFDFMLTRAGLIGQKQAIAAYIDAVFGDIMAL